MKIKLRIIVDVILLFLLIFITHQAQESSSEIDSLAPFPLIMVNKQLINHS